MSFLLMAILSLASLSTAPAAAAVVKNVAFLTIHRDASCVAVGNKERTSRRTRYISRIGSAATAVRSPKRIGESVAVTNNKSVSSVASSSGGWGVYVKTRFLSIYHALASFLVRPEKIRAVGIAISESAHAADILFLVFFGWGAVPLARMVNYFIVSSPQIGASASRNMEERTKDESREKSDVAALGANRRAFERTLLFEVANNLSQAARIGGAVYALRIVLVALTAAGATWSSDHISWLVRASARVMYTIWLALRVRYVKTRLLAFAVRKEPDELGRARVYDRMLDYLIYAVAAFFLIDVLRLPMGRGLQSIFAVSGIGSVVFGLASKELAGQVVSGLALSASQKFFDGDIILLGDGTYGEVLKVGVMETELRGSDEVVIRIPNSDIVNQRVSNLSRQEMSYVKQLLRFSYNDVKKLNVVMPEIKYQIQKSCPSLVTDGTRPFYAHLTDFKEDHVECKIQCHFRLGPNGDEYWDNRQTMLQAISRAAEIHGVTFSVPLRYNMNEEVTKKPKTLTEGRLFDLF